MLSRAELDGDSKRVQGLALKVYTGDEPKHRKRLTGSSGL